VNVNPVLDQVVLKSHIVNHEAVFSLTDKLQLRTISVVSTISFIPITKFLSKVKLQSLTLTQILYELLISKSNTALLERVDQDILKLPSSTHPVAQVKE
jgi:hypothetical protein